MMVSLTLSHVKVAVNLTKPLPSVVEFMRQSGEVVEVQVSYPWVPPTCSFCKELGHVSRNCLQAPPPPKSSDVPAKKSQQVPSASQKGKNVASASTASNVKPQPSPQKSPPSPSPSSSSSIPPKPVPPAPPKASLPPKKAPDLVLPATQPLALIPSLSKSPPIPFPPLH